MKDRDANSPDLTGNTLRTYLQVLKHGPCELRDVQHGLGFSTPSLASYHLSKLLEAGYVRQDEHARYVASKDALSDVLAGYSKIGTTIVPQLSFFAVLFSMLIGFFSIETLYFSRFTAFLIVVSVAAVIVMWYETLRLWRRLGVEWN